MNKYLIILLSLFLLVGCGEDDSSTSSASTGGKDLFSLWTRDDNLLSFDITGQNFSQTFPMGFILTTGEICECLAFIIGTQNSGTISVNNCSYYGGGAGDPNCPALWENSGQPYSYTRSGNSLEVCDAAPSCGTYN